MCARYNDRVHVLSRELYSQHALLHSDAVHSESVSARKKLPSLKVALSAAGATAAAEEVPNNSAAELLLSFAASHNASTTVNSSEQSTNDTHDETTSNTGPSRAKRRRT